MDALDETWSSWMRDIRLGVARILVAEEYLERGIGAGSSLREFAGQQATFNTDQEIFTPLKMAPGEREQGSIEPVQFEIRTEGHQTTVMSLLEEIVGKAGYSPSTFRATDENTAESGKALKIRERKSFRTTGRKERYFKPAVSDTLQIMLAIDQWIFGSQVDPTLRPRTVLSDPVSPDQLELAQVAQALHGAEAASIEVRVRMVHPDWSEDQVTAEVSRIKDESTMSVPVPTGVPEPEDLD